MNDELTGVATVYLAGRCLERDGSPAEIREDGGA